MLVIMHNTLCINHYASFGKHSKLSNFWVASDSLWVEPLLLESLIYFLSKIKKKIAVKKCPLFGLAPHADSLTS